MTKTFLLGGIAALGMATIAIAQPAPAPVAPQVQDRMDGTDQPSRVHTRAEVAAHVRTMFEKLDTDRDGFVTKAEGEAARTMHRQAMRGDKQPAPGARSGRPARDRGAMFDRLDSNKDGAISRAEFAAAPAPGHHARMAGKMARVHGRMHSRMRMGAMGMGGRRFAMADSNNDGRVSMQEATDAAFKHFDMADLNRDGRIVPEERRQMHQRMIEKHRATKSS